MYELYLRPSDMKRTRKENWLYYGDFSTESAAEDFALRKMSRTKKDFYVKFVNKPKTVALND